jgi:hypothetical protein
MSSTSLVLSDVVRFLVFFVVFFVLFVVCFGSRPSNLKVSK